MTNAPGHEPDQGWIDLDPRARIISLVLVIVAVCVVFSPAALAGLCLASFLMLMPSGLTLREVLRRLLPVNIFMALLWLTMPFLSEGPYCTVWGIAISWIGITQALIITLKANAIVAFTSAFLYPVETGTLAVGLHRLGVPSKMVWLLILSVRYVMGMADKVRKSALAIRMRSGKGGRMRFKAYGGLFAKLFVSSHESGERLYLAMRSRGYGDHFALRRQLCWRWRDSLVALCAAAFAGGAVWIGAVL